MFQGSVKFHVGDVVQMKKTHPCGSSEWEITRTGIDFGLRCVGCGRRILIPRPKFEKRVKKIVRYAVDAGPASGPAGESGPGVGAGPRARQRG